MPTEFSIPADLLAACNSPLRRSALKYHVSALSRRQLEQPCGRVGRDPGVVKTPNARSQSQFARLAGHRNGYAYWSLGSDVGCLLRGRDPLSSLRKDRAPLSESISTEESGLKTSESPMRSANCRHPNRRCRAPRSRPRRQGTPGCRVGRPRGRDRIGDRRNENSFALSRP